MSDLLIRGHLGLGDHLVTNAIVRDRATAHDEVVVLCKPHNAPSLAFMWRDLRNVELFSIEGDDEADKAVAEMTRAGYPVLALGFFGPQPFDPDRWDSEMFRQASLDPQLRWNGFKVDRQPSRELDIPPHPYIFVHDDPERGFAIPSERLPSGIPAVRPTPGATPCIFDYWGILENASEIHCIDSCFAIFVDSLPEQKASRLVWHHYARRGRPPRYCKPWIELP
jgi:hypothetical protein